VIQGNTLLDHWRNYLVQQNALRESHFDWEDLVLTDEGVHYHDISAKKFICCEGVKGRENPYFSSLPYNRNKGEALVLRIPGLPQEALYHFGLRLVPWQEPDLFWFGSSHEWTFPDDQPSQSWYDQAIASLNETLRLPYTVEAHLAAERPSVAGQVPFAGQHPHQPALVIFNGLGTRGYSSGPFFAQQLAQQLLHPQHDIPIADIQRFYKRWPAEKV
jgi:glycine/D-amino acid oxidase-like deaminating enzyme